MRTLIIIIIIVVVLYLGYRYVTKAWDNVNFKFYFITADLSGLSLASLTNILQGGLKVNAVIGGDIKNDNNYEIVFSGLKTVLSYNGSVIGETSDNLASNKFVVPANGTLSIKDNLTLTIDKSAANILQQKLSGASPSIDYSVKVNVYGISLPLVTNSFNW